MFLFWDTSAVLSLIFKEPHTGDAQMALKLGLCHYAWRWMRVEGVAGLERRRGTEAQRKHMDVLFSGFSFIDLHQDHESGIIEKNQAWRLRASDAGHLYCFNRSLEIIPTMELVAFDQELCAAARKDRLPVWTPPSAGPTLMVREPRVSYGRKRKHVSFR